MKGSWKGRSNGRVARAAGFGCHAIVQELEQRRLLSAGGAVDNFADEEIVADDAITMELAVEGSDAEGGITSVGDDEEVMYTMIEDGGEGEPLEDGEIRYTMMGEDGEAPLPDDGGGELQDYNGDGVIDELDQEMVITMVGGEEDGGEVLPPDDTSASGDGDLDVNGDGVIDEQDTLLMTTTSFGNAPATLKSNGRLIVRGTAGDDVIDVSKTGGKVIVTVNGVVREFDAADVTSVKVKARGGDDDVTIGTDVDAHVNCGRGNDTVVAGAGDDTVNGGKGDDDLSGGDGDDRIRGGRGKDALRGGAGTDNLGGGLGADELLGGLGDDRIRGGRGRDHVDAGDGNDLLDGGAGLDRIMAGDGIDAEQDTLDDILDPDASDDLFSTLRVAMPEWWDNNAGDAAQGELPSDTDDTLAPEDEAVA
jgi:Ca2+-binding RTX toxin-like protein